MRCVSRPSESQSIDMRKDATRDALLVKYSCFALQCSDEFEKSRTLLQHNLDMKFRATRNPWTPFRSIFSDRGAILEKKMKICFVVFICSKLGAILPDVAKICDATTKANQGDKWRLTRDCEMP